MDILGGAAGKAGAVSVQLYDAFYKAQEDLYLQAQAAEEGVVAASTPGEAPPGFPEVGLLSKVYISPP